MTRFHDEYLYYQLQKNLALLIKYKNCDKRLEIKPWGHGVVAQLQFHKSPPQHARKRRTDPDKSIHLSSSDFETEKRKLSTIKTERSRS